MSGVPVFNSSSQTHAFFAAKMMAMMPRIRIIGNTRSAIPSTATAMIPIIAKPIRLKMPPMILPVIRKTTDRSSAHQRPLDGAKCRVNSSAKAGPTNV